jgi:hypothetical protein
MRNYTRDEGRPFEVGNQVLISSHRKLLWSKATVVNVAEKSEAHAIDCYLIVSAPTLQVAAS